jgi:pimeloyl-ACP methyl ester carboxylesterase
LVLPNKEKIMGATFLVCHGAWSAGWAWKKMHPLMAAFGHRLVTPTYTGLGEREHLANPAIDLETHIADILNVIKYEDLRDIVLVGHSYGGMVATGVAARARDRVAQLIYIDAFVPDDGQSLLDLNEPARARMMELAKAGDGWRVPPNPTPPDTPPADLEWLTARRVNMPIKCFEMPLKLRGGELSLPRSYIYAKRITPADTFGRFATRAKSEPGWRYDEIDASHSPNVTAPEVLMALLQEIVAA